MNRQRRKRLVQIRKNLCVEDMSEWPHEIRVREYPA